LLQPRNLYSTLAEENNPTLKEKNKSDLDKKLSFQNIKKAEKNNIESERNRMSENLQSKCGITKVDKYYKFLKVF